MTLVWLIWQIWLIWSSNINIAAPDMTFSDPRQEAKCTIGCCNFSKSIFSKNTFSERIFPKAYFEDENHSYSKRCIFEVLQDVFLRYCHLHVFDFWVNWAPKISSNRMPHLLSFRELVSHICHAQEGDTMDFYGWTKCRKLGMLNCCHQVPFSPPSYPPEKENKEYPIQQINFWIQKCIHILWTW